jgi:predicted transposase/invertase (TIGR01784 family)
MTFINPKTDYAFKKIFGSSESKDILISFLNAMIYDGNPTIADLEIINPNLPPRVEGLKDTYLDVKAKLADGTLVIIEMQVLNVESFGKRVLYNAAKTYAFQLQKGEGYRMLKPVIALTLTDFEMFPNSEQLISRFIYKEASTNLIYTDNNIELVFVELPKFTKEVHQLETIADKWIYFMKYARTITDVPPVMDSVPEIHQAFDIANQVNLTPMNWRISNGEKCLFMTNKELYSKPFKQKSWRSRGNCSIAWMMQLSVKQPDSVLRMCGSCDRNDISLPTTITTAKPQTPWHF